MQNDLMRSHGNIFGGLVLMLSGTGGLCVCILFGETLFEKIRAGRESHRINNEVNESRGPLDAITESITEL